MYKKALLVMFTIISTTFLFPMYIFSSDLKGLSIVTKVSKVTKITQYGITWQFQDEVKAGRFINGDWWVIGPVEIKEITPSPAYNTNSNLYVNGTMIDPLVGSNLEGAGQSYDQRARLWNEEHVVSLPIVLTPTESQPIYSIISTISIDPDNPERPGRTCLKTAAVLTVVLSEPPEDAFRPGLVDGNKKMFRYSDIVFNNLPKLPAVSSIPSIEKIHEDYTTAFQRPWILHGAGYENANVKPEDNMPDYHRDIALLLGRGLILLLMDWGDREELLINYLQVALDYYAVATGGPGRGTRGTYQMPVLFAGIMFDDESIKQIYVNGTTSTPDYFSLESGTGSIIYWWGEQGRTNYGSIIPQGETWTYYKQRTGKEAVFHGVVIMNNQGAHEHLHPDEWYLIEEAGYDGGGAKQEVYRRQNSASAVAFALAARILNAGTLFKNTAYLPYVDRWMNETEEIIINAGGDISGAHPYQTSGADFVDDLWYRDRYNY